MKTSVQGRRRSAAVGVAGAAAVAGALVLAAPASAHTPSWSVTCKSVTVDLTNYKDGKQHGTNHVTLTIVSGEGALVDQDFTKSFHYQDALPPHDQPLTLRLVVTAWDHSGEVDATRTAPVCDDHTTPPTTAATTPPTTAATTTSAPSATPSGTTTAPVVATSSTTASGNGGLAETGSSNATPVIAGVAAAVVLIGGGLVLWTRRRGRSAHR